jgi:phosphoglucomutase
VIRKWRAFGGIILSASHNAGGPDGDFGIKYNLGNGGPANEAFTDAVYRRTLEISAYNSIDAPDIDLSRLGELRVGDMIVNIIDPVADYAELLESLFDFERIAALLARPDFRMRFDAMHAVTGPLCAGNSGRSPWRTSRYGGQRYAAAGFWRWSPRPQPRLCG